MGEHVECSEEVQEDEGHHVSSVQDPADVVRGGNEGGCSAVVGSEAKLCDVEELVGAEMVVLYSYRPF